MFCSEKVIINNPVSVGLRCISLVIFLISTTFWDFKLSRISSVSIPFKSGQYMTPLQVFNDRCSETVTGMSPGIIFRFKSLSVWVWFLVLIKIFPSLSFLHSSTTPPTVTSMIFFSVNGETFAREPSLLLSDRAIIRYFPSGAGGRFQGGSSIFSSSVDYATVFGDEDSSC